MKSLINKHKSILVLNGLLPSASLLHLLNTNVPIIAADGAANKLIRCDIMPTQIVGDGDSFDATNKRLAERFIVHQDQNYTDAEKCILFIEQQNLFPCLVLGATGGELDHTLGNMQALIKHANKGSFYLLDEYQKENGILGLKVGVPLLQGICSFKLPLGSIISLFPVSRCLITSQGLVWELKNNEISYNSMLAVRNFNKQENVTFDVQIGALMLVVEVEGLRFYT